MASLDTLDLVVRPDLDPGGLERVEEIAVALDHERWMSLLGWNKGLFGPKVDPESLAFEPAAPANGEALGLRDPSEAEEIFVERNGLSLAPDRHGELDVVKSHDAMGHPSMVPSASSGGQDLTPSSVTSLMGSLIKKRRKRMRKKKHKKMLKATRWQRRAAGK